VVLVAVELRRAAVLANWKTATAFIVPLATYSRSPSCAKQTALGEACSRSLGLLRAHSVSTSAPSRSSTLTVSLPALAQTIQRPSGETARSLASRPVTVSRTSAPVARSRTDTEPSLATSVVGSTRTSVPRPAGPTGSSGPGRRPPWLLT
jgi:hypothetical protein